MTNFTAPGGTTPNFSTSGNILLPYVYRLAVADVNQDGKPDIATLDRSGNHVYFLMNTTSTPSSPTFAAYQAIPLSVQPSDLLFSDVNQDGKPDLVIISASPNSVIVLLNQTNAGNPTVSFDPAQSFALTTSPAYISAGDVNGDGRPDLLVVDSSSNTVSVLLNTTVAGSATVGLLSQQDFGGGVSPSGLVAADFNRDGKVDIATTNQNANTVSVLLNSTIP
jgi:hypothetical protein